MPKPSKKYHQTVVVDYDRNVAAVYRVVSDREITRERVIEHFEQTMDFCENGGDSIMFVQDVTDEII